MGEFGPHAEVNQRAGAAHWPPMLSIVNGEWRHQGRTGSGCVRRDRRHAPKDGGHAAQYGRYQFTSAWECRRTGTARRTEPPASAGGFGPVLAWRRSRRRTHCLIALMRRLHDDRPALRPSGAPARWIHFGAAEFAMATTMVLSSMRRFAGLRAAS